MSCRRVRARAEMVSAALDGYSAEEWRAAGEGWFALLCAELDRQTAAGLQPSAADASLTVGATLLVERLRRERA